MNRVRLAVVCTLLALGAVTLRASAGIAAEHLAQAVRFPTISHQDTSLVDTDAFLALHEFLRATYPLTFATLEVEVVNDLSLLLIWRGSETAARPILFTSHMDVVPVEPGTEEEWTHPAFDGVIDDGIIYGRGTLDDKLGVISLLEATERLLGEGFAPQRTVVLAFGHDEEVLGFNGAARLAERMRELGLHFEWMVDEGGLILTDAPQLPQRKMANVNVAEKTYYTLRLAATGEGGHSSMPPAHTSIGKLAAALARIEEHPFEARLEEPVRSMLTGLAAHVDLPDSLILSNLWITSPLVIRMMEQQRATSAMVRTTTAITIFNGGVKENVVPQKAEAFVNFRLLPGDTVESVRARIIELVDDSDITVEPVSEQARTPPIADMEGGGFRVIAEAVGRSYPDAVILPGLLNGATDIRHYVDLADNHYRFHGAAMSIADTSGIHGTDEKLGVDSFERTVDIAVEMIRIGSD